MKTTHISNCLPTFVVVLASALGAQGQGIVTFDAHPYFSGTNYIELGMRFALVAPTLGNHDGMATTPAVMDQENIPYSSTPYMVFFRQFSPDDYVSLSLTNGLTFGLTSVFLADPSSPSYTALPMTFKGHKADGSTVTDTLTTPGGGADHLANYLFTPDFASGLTGVDILATRWAMDNLVFTVPEPGSASLLIAGLLALAVRTGCRRRAGHLWP